MNCISDFDQNFKNPNAFREDMVLFNVKEEPFSLHGFCHTDDGSFRRIPYEIASRISKGMVFCHSKTSGGRVRFRTDSPYVILKVKVPSFSTIPHMPITGTGGFDLYADGEFVKALFPPITYDGFEATFDLTDGFEAIATFESKKMRDIVINFPLYNDVDEVFVGVSEDSQILEPLPYKHSKPIVFYGSSITQGCCVSRPGNLYMSIISRWFDTDFVGLGFSGNATAGEVIANYITELDMSMFVYDYDFNSPTEEHLKRTHEQMFLTIRQKHPHIPIIMASRVNAVTEENKRRFKIIEETYTNALARGDKNVYLINGMDILCSIDKEMFTVDGVHPNDFGSYCMAKAFGQVIEPLLK